MPWFPDFANAAELARSQLRAAGRADPVGQYLTAVHRGDAHDLETVWPGEVVVYDPHADAIVATFAPDGYYRETIGPPTVHRGAAELRSFFSLCFSAGGGIGLECCCVTDDGVRCAMEYNCVRWGSHDLQPQAGIAVFERGPDGLLGAARVYDDVEPPVTR